MARTKKAPDISYLAGHLNEPIRKDELLEAARSLAAPFVLREVVDATGLPKQVCHRILGRLVRQGVATRIKMKISYRNLGRGGGVRQRRVWGYTLVGGQ